MRPISHVTFQQVQQLSLPPQLWEWLLLLPQQHSNKISKMISQMQEQLLSKLILSPHLCFSVLLYARILPKVSCPAK